MQVLKFGGTSVKTSERIKNLIDIIASRVSTDPDMVVVVSAQGGVTDQLIKLSNQARNNEDTKPLFDQILDRHIQAIDSLAGADGETRAKVNAIFHEIDNKIKGVGLLRELSPKTLDSIIVNGEILSALIINAAFNAKGIPAKFLDTRKCIFCNDSYGNGLVNFQKTTPAIREYFSANPGITIATGFIATSQNNDPITLGRGGSDYTAAIIGAALNVKTIEIWTDVSGMYTADPSKVAKAFRQEYVSFSEAMELCHFGAKVIYPPTLMPAMAKSIPILVKNSFRPEDQGTIIGPDKPKRTFPICGISSITEVALLRLEGGGMVGVAGVAKRFFSALASRNINIILITQASSEHTICAAILPKDSKTALQAVDEEFSLEIHAGIIRPLIAEENLSIISVVGENMRNMPGMAGKTFSALGKNGVNVIAIAQGSSELNISAVIQKVDEIKALKALHEEFFFHETRTIHVYLAGAGLIGSALLRQISAHKEELAKKHSHEIRLVGIANSKGFKINPEGLNITELDKIPAEQGSITQYIEKAREINLPNSLFVDCTASSEVASHYHNILGKSISIVTPNKKAQTGPYTEYLKTKQAASRRGVSWLYETSCGAGLPIINTLNDLIRSGDSIIKIEAVLSGTLSYIFNSFKAGIKFSDVVKNARKSGYTEPDPRDDLNGLDFARKILILARECGHPLELGDLQVENLVPEKCRNAKSADEFMSRLPEFDEFFEGLRAQAENSGRKLCYLGSFDGQSAKVQLQTIDAGHPFYSLSGSDNIVSFTTKRYFDRPLVIKGPGAGAEVTAAGVFADIIRLAD